MQSVADYEAWKAKQQQAKVKASAFVIGQSDGNPDELAGDLQLATDFAAATGNPKPPAPMVSEYRSVFQAAIEKTRAETILSSSPRLTDWLRDPENATLAKDDLDTLSWWESAAIVPRGIASAAPAFNEGFYNVAGTVAALPGRNRVSDEMFRLADVARGMKEDVAGPSGNWLGRQVQGASQSIGMMTPGIAATLLSGGTATPAVMAAYLLPGAVTQGGQSSRQGMDAGLSPERALLYGGTNAAAEVLFERIPVGKLLGDIAEGAGFGQILVNQLAREIPTETATTLFQNFNEWVTINPDKTVSEFVAEQPEAIRDTVAQTFLATLGMSGLGAGVSRLSRFSEEQARARDAEARVAMFQELSGQAVASKLRARMPERFRDFVERATQNGPIENVYVPASEFASYFQTAGIDPYVIVDQLEGVTRDDLDAALAGYGGDLKIPTATYAAHLAGTEHDAFFMQNMRINPMDADAREAAEFNARVDDIMQEMWDEAEDIRLDEERWRAVEEKIYDEFVSRQRIAGRSTEEATANAIQAVAFYRTRAVRMGLTTEEYLKRHPLPGIQGAIPQGMQFRNVDELNRTLAEARNRRAPVMPGRPAATALKERGGIDPSGPLAAELRARGVNPKTAPGLFRKGGLKNADNIPLSDVPMMQNRGVDDGNGYVSEQAWIDALEAEGRKEPWAEVDEVAFDENDRYLNDIEAYLNRLGLDLDNTDEEIRQAIERDQAGGDRMYGQFAGPQAQTADIHALATAKDRLAAGANPEVVRRETGWFRGPDLKWRYEITDNEARLALWLKDADIAEEQGEEYMLADLLNHDRLYAAYPDLAIIPVKVDNELNAWGQVNGYGSEMILNLARIKSEGGDDALLSTILHEVQHLIQRREGFARGGNTEMSKQVKDALVKLSQERRRRVGEYENENWMDFKDAGEARRMVGNASLFQDFNRLIDYSRMDRPSGVFRHIRNATQWLHSPVIRDNPDLRDESVELYRRLYTLPRSGPKRNAFLRTYAFDLAQLLRKAVPEDRWQMLKDDPRKTASLMKALERESAKASAKLRPYQVLKDEQRLAEAQADKARYASPFEIYQLLAGEVEARNTENRMRMTEEERRNTSPDATMTRDDIAFSGEKVKSNISTDEVIVVLQTGEITSPFVANSEGAASAPTYLQSAYHGSPHLFTKFSLDKIGTGEGAQAFGWGLYFAGRKEIAEYYRDTLSKRNASDAAVDTAEYAWQGSPEATITYLEDLIGYDRVSGRQMELTKEALRLVKDGWTPETKGRLYQVEIPDDVELLNWDAPLKDQPAGVREKLKPMVEELRSARMNEFDRKEILSGKATAEQFYRAYSQHLATKNGTGTVSADRRASEALRAAGIPGHRYLDGGSRDSGGGTFNYVIYDDSRVQVSRFEQGPRGQITFNMDGSSMIRLFETANLSTVQHEMGHLFLTMMQRDVATGDQAAVAEYEVIKSWWRENAAAVAKDGNRAMPDAKLTAEDVQRAIDTGTTGDMMKDAAIDVGMQEQWARGYEAYLMEGKAPSVELRGVFEKFRSWMLRVYRSLVGLNVNITPEIRAVFDRMLATDEEIAKAKQTSGETAPIFTTAEQMGLTQEEFDRLMKLRTQAEDEAKARLQVEIMEPIRRETEKEYMAEKAKVTEDVTQRLRRMPVYRAIQEMRFGKTFEGDETPGVKLDRDVIEAQYGAGYLPFLPGATKDGKGHRNAVFTNEGGIHPDVAAAMYGFETGRELLDMMSNAPALDDAIKAEVEAEMYQKHGDPLNDGEIERKALEALHNDKRGEWLAAELKAVVEVAGVDLKLTMKEANATAAMTLGQMKVRDARMAMRFLAAERKNGEQAQRIARELGRESVWMQNARRRIAVKARAALRDAGTVDAVAGQIDQANASTGNYNETVQKLIDAKRRQLMNHALFRESVKQREAIDKIVDRMAKLNRPDKKLSKSITVDHLKAARAIAAKFGLARPDTEFDFNAWLEQLAFEDPTRAAALEEAIAIWGQDAKDYRDLTVVELGAVVDGIDNVLAAGKRFSGIETAGKRIEREQAVAELVAVLEERGYPENEAMSGLKSIMSGAKSLTSSTRAMLRVVETWARTMDNGEQGPFTNYIVRPVMDALGVYFDNRNQKMKELLAIVDRTKSMTGQAIPAPELRTAGAQPFTFQNKAALIHAILHTGNESNKAKLLIGWGFSDGFVNPKQAMTAAGKPRVKRDGTPILTKGELDTSRWDAFLDRMIREGVITSEDIDLVNSIWAVFEETKRPAQATHKKLKGFYFKEIENSPYQTAAGLLKGGYVPAIIDKEASLDAGRQEDMRALDQSATSMFPTTGAGFTKSRVENYREPLELNLMLLPAHLDDVLRFTYLEPAIQQTAALVRGRDMRDPMQRFDPNVVGDTIMPWLQRTASRSLNVANASPAKRKWGRAMDRMRGRVGVGIMFMNVINTAQQVTGPIVAMSEVSPRLLGNALVRLVSGDAGNMREAISKASPYMAERLRLVSNDTQVELRELLTDRTVFSEIDAFTQKHGYILQSAFQNLLDPIVWHGAYDQAISRGMSHEAAVFDADSAVRRFMPDSAPENVTAFAQGTVTWRMLTMFTSFFISQANLLGGRADVIRRQMGWNGAPQMFWAYLTIFALPAIVAQAIADAASGVGPEDEDEDGMMDELLAWFGITQLRYGAAMVPLFGQAGLKTINAFNDNPVDDRLSVSPVVSAIETATRSGASVYGAVADDGSAQRAVTDGLRTIGLITGIPTGQLSRTVGYGVGVSEDRFSPTGPVDVVQGVLSGRDGTQQ